MFPSSYTAFNGHRRIASGSPHTVALVVKQAIESGASDPVLIFDDSTGRSVDIDTRGSDEEVVARLAQPPATSKDAEAALSERPDQAAPAHVGADARVGEPRGRGRPKLGVVPREVTLLPRHWEWLATQPGGASVALRKLVEEARRTRGEKDRCRRAHERAYHFMSAMAGDMPGFEEATRALFANDEPRFRELIGAWPDDVRNHTIALAFGEDCNTFPSTL
ncbi:hypothetical protein LMG28727_01436 [Paraburkholderia kirstenboschensis]|uniref:DUF2239 family protein n=1 Tax=Paraburkholderia kirstenboschensis TaxID=1245436 RepID=UPI000FFCBA9F|nr:DUF2239 family protein [Paraburkholderia kirstenboschensis]CAD6520634.1 hypothetical protein LMG28727_01436 [Paraburkholderia kirstenboschensis]